MAPFEYKLTPHQIRALLLLLVLLPLIPGVMLARFMIENVTEERELAREGATDAYAAQLRQLLQFAEKRFQPDTLPDTQRLQPAHTAAPAGASQRWTSSGDGWYVYQPGPELLLAAPGQALRQHLEQILEPFTSPDSQVSLLDDNDPGFSPDDGGTVFVQSLLPPPLPAWRAELRGSLKSFTPGAAPAERYVQTVLVLTLGIVAIALTAGFAIRRHLALNELRSDALSTVSHELKTPLASSRMLIDTLLAGKAGGEGRQREYYELLARENARLERVVGGLLTYSRAASGSLRLNLKPTPVAALAGAAVATIDLPPEVFELRVDPGLPAIMADQEAMVTVLTNLLENAVKFSGVDRPRQITLHVKEEREQQQVLFEVRDNGIGIPAAEQKKIFQRFYQADERLARVTGGCGLGLYIVRLLLEAQKGHCEVESTPGGGSVFRVLLPVARGRGEGAEA